MAVAYRNRQDRIRQERRHRLGGVTQESLAAEYGVTPPLIGYIVRGENWKEGNF